MQHSPSRTQPPTGSVSKTPFPVKLLEILETASISIICWADHGLSFFVRDQDLLVEQIFPLYFRQHKFSSFKRQLNLYGFRFMTKGLDSGAYFHPLFRRDRPDLVRYVIRVPKNCPEHTLRSNALANHLKARKPGESVHYEIPSPPVNNFQRNRKSSKSPKPSSPQIYSPERQPLAFDETFYPESLLGSPASSTDTEFDLLKDEPLSFSGPPSPIPLFTEGSGFELKDELFEMKDYILDFFQTKNQNASYDAGISSSRHYNNEYHEGKMPIYERYDRPEAILSYGPQETNSSNKYEDNTSDLTELIDIDFDRRV